MKSPKLLEGAIARTSALLTETGRDVEAAIAARQAKALQVGRQIGARVGRAALDVARSQVAAPGLERQLMRVVAATAPKLAAPQSKTSTKSKAPQLSAAPAAVRREGRRAPEPLMQVDAFVRGAADILSFGKADEMEAGIEALGETAVRSVVPGWDNGRSLVQRYETQLGLQQQRDQFDAAHRTAARSTGQTAGVVAGLAVGTGLGAGGSALVRALPNGARIVRNAEPVRRLGLDMRGVNTLAAGGGGAVGALDQLVADLSHGEFSDPEIYAASTAAGVAGGLAARYGGATVSGGVSGGLTPAFKSVATGDAPSADDIAEGVVLGGVGAGIANRAMGALGKYGSSALPSKVKGDLGEALSYAKSVTRDGRLPKTQIGVDVGGRRTIADQLLGDGSLLEAKFGRWAKLSQAQRAALRKLRDKYLIDHYQPKDVGRILGFGPAISTGQMAGDDQNDSAP